MTDAIEARIAELVADLRQHKLSYYNGEPEISDAEYDALEEELRGLEQAYPELKVENSPTDAVGAPVGELFSAVRHTTPMLSLEKAHTDEQLDKFFVRFPGTRFAAMPKFDGTSLSLSYEQGKLVRAATRGDGVVGEDVTVNVSAVKELPQTLPLPIDCEVRGEIVMMKPDFEAYNAANPASPLKNTRNGAAGTLRAKTREKVASRPITFLAFDVIGNGALPDTTTEALTQLGFRTERFVELDSAEAVRAYIRETAELRAALDFEIDGVVIRLADRREYENAGATGSHPKGAIAFKLAAELGETTLLDVTWQVGKSGTVAPVAEIQTLFLAGTDISRATLHNLTMIAEKEIRIGDRIQIRRAGDVIPHVDGVAPGYVRTGEEREIVPPTNCPSCDGPLVEVGASRILQCENVQGCPAQNLRRLIHWASRAAADIDAIGQSWIERFVDEGLLNRPSDFYRLTAEQLSQFEGMGTRLTEKMLASIETSKNVGLRKTMIGFAIPLASEGTAKRLCRNGYASIEQVTAASQAALEEVEDIGPAVAASLVSYFREPATLREIVDLRSLGVNLDTLPEDAPVVVEIAEGEEAPPLFGKAVCITGKLTIDRATFQKLVEKEGANAVSGVSAKTDFLICGPDIFEKGSSKLKNAEKFNVPVLTEDDARAMFRTQPTDAVAP